MTKKTSPETGGSENAQPDALTLKDEIHRHMRFTMGRDPEKPNRHACFMGLAYSVRDRLMRPVDPHPSALQYETLAKRVYFLSLEFLPGRFLMNYLISLKMVDEARQTISEIGFDLDELEEEEWDAGLGNGGLGRLASCYMDSLACLDLPGYGYGIRYDYGIFHQTIENGWQREQCDNWSRKGTPWEIRRGEYLRPVRFYGHTGNLHGCRRPPMPPLGRRRNRHGHGLRHPRPRLRRRFRHQHAAVAGSVQPGVQPG